MANRLGNFTSFVAGISDSEKSGTQFSLAFNRNNDFRSDPKKVTVSPGPNLDSGNVVTGLPLWFEAACEKLFAYDEDGAIYTRSSGSWSKSHIATNSSGNGLGYFSEDGNLYYPQDTTIGRLNDACNDGGTFTDNFLGVEGGDPTNTKSIDLESSSTQYASVSDNSNLSITADITMEAYARPESLPTEGNIMTLMSKWSEQSNQRSYKMDITTTSSFFGDGSDGALTISSDTTESPIDASCSGTQGTKTLSATNASFAAGQKILIIQMQGTNAGVYQETEIESYTAGTITTVDPLSITFSSTGSNKAQVIVGEQYTDVTIQSGFTYYPKAWDGSVGGVMYWFANGTFTYDGNLNGDGRGFRGGKAGQNPNGSTSDNIYGEQGESETGSQSRTATANGSGGGGGGPRQTNEQGNGGGGAGHAVNGDIGGYAAFPVYSTGDRGVGGSSKSGGSLTSLHMGSGGGGGGFGDAEKTPLSTYGAGGNGGAVLFLSAATITAGTGVISSNGNAGQNGSRDQGGGGGGAGGSILFRAENATLGSSTTATGGSASGATEGSAGGGGAGSAGFVSVYYLTSYTGSSNPTINPFQDDTLQTTTGYVLRLGLSSNGTAEEFVSWDITDLLEVDKWNRWQITWEDTTGATNFYANGSLLGQKTSSTNAIYDSTAAFAIGTDFDGSGNAQNLFDGLMDDVRLWNDVRTASELLNKNDTVLVGNEANLIAYYELEGDVTDSQTNVTANNLTASGSPTYSSNVPFTGLTTRQDADVENTSGSFTGAYSLATTISETDANRLYFTPTKEPHKSITLDIDTVGTGNWTVTIHDALDREVASVTVNNSELTTGFYEFVYDTAFRPTRGATYHAHITSTVADGSLDVLNGQTTLSNGSSTIYAYFVAHYQFLVSDKYHPVDQIVNKLAIGNERYVATLEGGDIYDPHAITLPSGQRVRCFAKWRDYLAIGIWQGTNIYDFDYGYVYFWDGISDTYDHFVYVPGGVNSMYGDGDVLYMSVGYSGELYAYTGGGSISRLKQIPKLQPDEYLEIAPDAMKSWLGYLHIGSNLLTDSSTVYQGVYTYGTKNINYPLSLGLSHGLSFGVATGTSAKVGSIFPFGRSMYVGWQDNNKYGIDEIALTNDKARRSTIELLIADLGAVSKDDYPLVARVDHSALSTGESVVIKMKADRASDWTTLTTEDTAGATETRTTINQKMKEVQIAVDVITTVATAPDIYEVSLEAETGTDDVNI